MLFVPWALEDVADDKEDFIDEDHDLRVSRVVTEDEDLRIEMDNAKKLVRIARRDMAESFTFTIGGVYSIGKGVLAGRRAKLVDFVNGTDKERLANDWDRDLIGVEDDQTSEDLKYDVDEWGDSKLFMIEGVVVELEDTKRYVALSLVDILPPRR